MVNKDISYEQLVYQLRKKPDSGQHSYEGSSVEKFMLSLSPSDIYYLRTTNSRKIETIEKMGLETELNLNKLNSKHDNNYRQLIWKVKGSIVPDNLIKGYKELLNDYPIIRTRFFKSSLSVASTVVYENDNEVLPIYDLTDMDEREQSQKLINVASAEARRSYNPEKDAVLRIQIFILKEFNMAVVVSFIPAFTTQIDRPKLMNYVFKNMRIEGDIDEPLGLTAKSINSQMRAENISYWRQQVKELGKSLKLPGELSNFSVDAKNKMTSSIYKRIDDDLYKSICLFESQHNVQKKSIFMYAWCKLLSNYNNVKKIVLATGGNQNEPPVYPVTVDTNESMEMCLQQLNNTWEKTSAHGYLTMDDYEDIFSERIYDHFHFHHHFLDVQELMEKGEFFISNSNLGNGKIGLMISYNMYRDNCSINYVYHNNKFYDEAIEQLHSVYEHFLQEILAGDLKIFDKEKFISEQESNEEKLRKIAIAQRAIYIKDTKLFNLCNAQELMDISELATLQKCVIDDNIVTAGSAVDKIGFVADGIIEENTMDRKGYVKSLRLLSKGSVIGIEALLEDNTATNTYTVASENASIVWMDKNDLVSILNKKPDLWRSFLAYEHKSLGKIQRAWSLQ